MREGIAVPRGCVMPIAYLRQLRQQRRYLQQELAVLLADIARLKATIRQLEQQWPGGGVYQKEREP